MDKGEKKARKEYLSKLKVYTILTFSATMANFLLRLLRSSLYARILGPSNRGIFGLFSVLPSMMVDFGSLGVELGNAILVTRRRVELRIVLGNTVLFTLCSSVVMAIIGYLLLSYEIILKDSPGIVRDYLPLIMMSIPLHMLEGQGKYLLQAMEKIKEYNAVRLLFPASAILLFLGTYAVTREGLKSAVAAWIGSYVIGNAWVMFCLLKEAGWSMRPSWRHFKTSIGLGMRGYFSTFADEMLSKFDLVLIGFFLGSKELGFYVVSVAVVGLVLQSSGAVNSSLLPLRLRLKDKEGMSVTPVVARHVLFIMLLLCFAAAGGGKPLIMVVFGVDFLPAYIPMLWLLPGVLFRSLYRILKTEMYSMERLGFVSMVSVAALLVNLVLNVLLIPRMGIVGAALSTSVANLCAAALLLVFYHYLTGVPYRKMLLIRGSEVRRLLEKVRKAYDQGKSHVLGMF